LMTFDEALRQGQINALIRFLRAKR
jgi:hypothetical protein